MRIPLAFCGFRLHFADSIYNCGFYDIFSSLSINIKIQHGFHQLSQISQYLLRILQTLLRLPQSGLFFEAILQNTMFQIFVRSIQSSKKEFQKSCNVAESARNSKNAHFGLVMFFSSSHALQCSKLKFSNV